MGQPPASVKRHAEAVDRFAQQQGFKPHLRGDGIDRFYFIQQGVGMAVIGDPLHVVQLHLRQHAALLAQPGIRVGAQQQTGTRVVTPRRRDHRLKILSVCERAGNREIPRYLVNQQHLRARIVVQAGCQRIG
ncbi:Uncharacterised protein [Klebsiella pneumoniae]|nr:Uncharacterised protein [Klebsiella pneumoniae]